MTKHRLELERVSCRLRAVFLTMGIMSLTSCSAEVAKPPSPRAVIDHSVVRQVTLSLDGTEAEDGSFHLKCGERVSVQGVALAVTKFPRRAEKWTEGKDVVFELGGVDELPKWELFLILVAASPKPEELRFAAIGPVNSGVSKDQKEKPFKGQLQLPTDAGMFELRLCLVDSSMIKVGVPLPLDRVVFSALVNVSRK